MSPQADTAASFPADPPTDTPVSKTRPFYWSVRRELWENRSIYVAPAAIAGLILFGVLLGGLHLGAGAHNVTNADLAQHGAMFGIPLDIAAVVLIVVSVLTGAFYCLGALHGERRDRSILFWKSLPVSDLTSVAAKASIPLLLLPAIASLAIVATQLIIFLFTSALLASKALSVGLLWSQVPFFDRTIVLLYGLVTLTLWYAPIYGWLIMVSAWARRAPFLWAVLPPLALCLVEKLALDSSIAANVLHQRLIGSFEAAFDIIPHAQGQIDLSQCDPLKFLSSPGLWVGLVVAGAFFAAAVWLRRRGEPI